MKKVIYFFVCFFFLINYASAINKPYYSDYSDFSSWGETNFEEDDLTIVEKERRYKWYKKGENIGDYYIEGENDSSYPLIDKNDYLETEYSDWQSIKPEQKNNRTIDSRYVYQYQNMQEVRYIHLNELQGSYGSLRISEIEVYAGNNKIDYNYYCEGCSSNFESFIKNSLTIENMSYVNNGGYVRLDLNNYYPLDSLIIKLYLFDVGNLTKRYNLKITRDQNLNSSSFSEITIASFFTYDDLTQIKPFVYSVNNMSIKNPEWYEIQTSLDPLLPTATRLVNVINEYRYKDILYRYYNNEVEYSSGYSKDPIDDYTIKDENLYKDYYRYKKREKVIIDDNLYIKSRNTSLEDFIISSTIDDIKIESNVDVNKNGVYEVKYILPFQTITKEVTVDILDNTFSDLNEKIHDQTIQNQKMQLELRNKDIQLAKLRQEKEELVAKLDSVNNGKSNDSFDKIKLMLEKYDNRLESYINMTEKDKAMIEVLNNNNKVLKQNYISILSKLEKEENHNLINKEVILIIAILSSGLLVLSLVVKRKKGRYKINSSFVETV